MAQARAKELNVREHLGTPTDLRPEATRDISAALSALLADTFALYLKTKNFHWHMSGRHFRDYHLLLDEHGDQIFSAVALRRVDLRFCADGRRFGYGCGGPPIEACRAGYQGCCSEPTRRLVRQRRADVARWSIHTCQPQTAASSLPITLNPAPLNARNRQVNTLETGTLSRWKAAPDIAPIRHVFRRLAGTYLSLVLLTVR